MLSADDWSLIYNMTHVCTYFLLQKNFRIIASQLEDGKSFKMLLRYQLEICYKYSALETKRTKRKLVTILYTNFYFTKNISKQHNNLRTFQK